MNAIASPHGIAVGRLKRARKRSARERRWLRLTLWAGVGGIAIVVLLSCLQPLLPLPHPNATDYSAVLQAPSWSHPMGTDDVGRDLLSRSLAAARVDLPVVVLMTMMSGTIGVMLGGLAGFFGGVVDAIVMRVADIVIAFPFLVLVLAIITIFGPGLTGILVGVPLVGWAVFARLTRAEMLVVREQEYMLATEVLGFSRRRALLRHAIPNVWRPILAWAMTDMVLNMVTLASLSYLGVGILPPTPEWGAIIASGQHYVLTAWWISTLPGIFVVVVAVGLSQISDAIADVLGRDLTVGAS